MMTSITFCTAMLGMFMAVPLFVIARNRSANMWLGMFVFSLASLCFADLYSYYPGMFGVFDWPLALLGPCYYCYVRSMVGLGNGRRQAVHFLPLLLFAGFLLYLNLGTPFGARAPMMEVAFNVVLLAIQVLCFGYAFASLFQMRLHRRRVRENFSSTRQRDLNWLTSLSMVILALLIIWIPATTVGGVFLWALCIGRLALLYFVGWFGLRSFPVFMPQPEAAALTPVPVPVPVPVAAPAAIVAVAEPVAPPAPESTEKYARSGMTDAASEMIGQRLVRRIAHHRDYLENDINLAELAGRIGATPQLLSQYLNNVLGLNFFDYINGLRVAEVQKKMLEPEHAGANLLELALSCGFNSKSTFNASFKRVAGVAPSAWRAEHTKMAAATPV